MDFADIYEGYGLITEIMDAAEKFGMVMQIGFFLSLIIPYFVIGYMHMCVGRKAKVQPDWMAFIPITRQLYEMKIAECPWWYVFFFKISTITVVSTGFISSLIFALTKKPAIIIVLLIIYMIANLVFTFLYYQKYYYFFGFNSNTAWIQIVPFFSVVALVLTTLIAFSDAIKFRGKKGPQPDVSVIVEPPNPAKSVVTGLSGKYLDATFDISDGAEIVFGRSATDCNIIFDQFATDISRKHCGIRFDGGSGQYIVTDYSSNGTFLENGTKLEKEKPKSLPKGTILYLGSRKNTFRLG